MQVGITGASGLVGTALSNELTGDGHNVVALPRGGPGEQASWQPADGWIHPRAFEGCDAVVHLAGASIGDGRWTAARKRLLRASRVDATRLLVDHLARLPRPPGVLVCASAVGYYGDRGDEVLDESSEPGAGFLADLVRDWEHEARRAAEFGIRVVSLRFGIVLATHGGALPRMLRPFRLGVGGRLGSGSQWFSWVTLRDATRAAEWALTHELSGALNVTSPEPVTNAAFTRALAGELHRPALLPAPRVGLRMLLGEAADELLLASTRAVPARLLASGFAFEHGALREALPAVLQRGPVRDRHAA